MCRIRSNYAVIFTFAQYRVIVITILLLQGYNNTTTGYNKLLSSNHNMATVVCAGWSRSPDLSSGLLRILSGDPISIPWSTSSRRPL